MGITKKYIIVAFTILWFAIATDTFASQLPDCQQIYGGGSACEQNSPATINIQIKNPDTLVYAENLIATDPKYGPEQKISFKVTVTNPSNTTIKNSNTYFYFPSYVDYVQGEGIYDKTKKILRNTIAELKAKERKEFLIEAKVTTNTKLPEAQDARCVLNAVEIIINNKTSQDSALVCLAKDGENSLAQVQTPPTAMPTKTQPTPTKAQLAATKQQSTPTPTKKPQPTAAPAKTKGGLPMYQPAQAKNTPETGPETAAIPGLLSLLGFGFFLRSKAKA